MYGIRMIRNLAMIAMTGVFAWGCSQAANSAETAAMEAATSTENAADKVYDGEVVGQVVDASCYLSQGLSGDPHRQCAELCANDLGIPLNILDDDGKLWQLVDDDMPGSDQNPTVIQYAEQRVRATGKLISKGGNHAIIVKGVELVEGSANPRALEKSSNPDLGRMFNVGMHGANPCAANPCAANPCAANPCASTR